MLMNSITSGIFWLSIIPGAYVGYVIYKAEKSIPSSIFCGLLGGVGAFIFFAAITVISMNASGNYRMEMWNTTHIYSVKDGNSGLKGSFFLGSGSIETEWYYITFVDTDRGLHKEKYEQDMTYIKETNTTSPHVEKYLKITKPGWFLKFMTGRDESKEATYDHYVLHVPENTIIKEFHLE